MKLPIFLQPKHKCDLIRLGQKNDGGYSIPKKSLEDSEFIFGFGLSDDWSFERDFKNLSGAKIICYDHSVNLRYWLVRFCRDVINLFLLKKDIRESYQRFITYFKYKIFFNGKEATHERKMIAPINQNIYGVKKSQMTDLNQILYEKKNFNFFLKIDIEHHEYRILDQIIKYQTWLTGLVIEFHDVDLHLDKILKFIDQSKLKLIHIHGNNWMDYGQKNIPTCLEITFSKNPTLISEQVDFPHILDQKNNPNADDIILNFEN